MRDSVHVCPPEALLAHQSSALDCEDQLHWRLSHPAPGSSTSCGSRIHCLVSICSSVHQMPTTPLRLFSLVVILSNPVSCAIFQSLHPECPKEHGILAFHSDAIWPVLVLPGMVPLVLLNKVALLPLHICYRKTFPGPLSDALFLSALVLTQNWSRCVSAAGIPAGSWYRFFYPLVTVLLG